MTRSKQLLAACAATVLACGSLFAQEAGFDLSAQRRESQDIPPVPGRVLDHHGLVVNPTPHTLRIAGGSGPDITRGMKRRDVQGKFAADLDFVAPAKSGAELRIDFGPQIAARNGVKAVSGAYALRIDPKGAAIVGYDERGAYYGIQTLRQIVASPLAAGGKLPCLEIDDWPDLPYRGVVEGFYGNPWSHEVRLSLLDFYGRFKMNYYLYGPKDDPYHSCPDWRLPYPEREAQHIRELVEAANRNRVHFVWAIHPGQDIRWNDEDYANLVNKFERMYALGVRAFAIFFDDIDGEGTNPERQTGLLNRLNREFVEAKGDVLPLIVCPTDYSRLWANPSPQGALSVYGRTLDPSVGVFWTGDVVCSDLTRETMAWVDGRIRRPALYWWNFPVTDYARHIVMQGPAYGLDTSLTAGELCGLISNPMEYGEASKLALYGVADYGWNIAAYNPLDNWERGLWELAPEAREAYRTFAIHSCDTETGYRRDESWETETFRIGDYTQEQFDALREEFEKVAKTPAEMEAKCANRALLAELRPWLAEFGKLGERGLRTLELIRLSETAGDAEFWEAYVGNLMSAADRKAYDAHKSGTMKLQPFYENAMDDLAAGFYRKLTGEEPAVCRGIGSFANASTTLSKLMFDNDSTTFYTSSAAQSDGSWLGADLGCVREVAEVAILQGRNSTDDVDYFDHALLECSADGRNWQPLTDSLRKQYVIRWQGAPVRARYVRLRKLPSAKTNWAAVRSFEVNPVRAERLGFDVEAPEPAKALLAFDGNPGTGYACAGKLAFGIPEGASACTLLLRIARPGGKVLLRELSQQGATLAETSFDRPFVQVRCAEGAARIELEGEAEVFEVLFE